MKLIRYGEANLEKPGLIDASGNLRDLSDHISDIDGRMLNRAKLDDLGRLTAEALPVVKVHQDLAPVLVLWANSFALA